MLKVNMLLIPCLIALVTSQSYIDSLEGLWRNQVGSTVSFNLSIPPSSDLWYDIAGWYINAAGDYRGVYKLTGRGGFNLPLTFSWNVVWYTPSGVSIGVTSWNGYLDLENQQGNLTFLANWLLTFESDGVWNNTLIGQDKFVKID